MSPLRNARRASVRAWPLQASRTRIRFHVVRRVPFGPDRKRDEPGGQALAELGDHITLQGRVRIVSSAAGLASSLAIEWASCSASLRDG